MSQKKATPKEKPEARRVVDWARIEHEFVTQPDRSIRDLARKYKVSERMLQDRVREGDWRAERAKTVEQVRADARDKLSSRIAEYACRRFVVLLERYAAVTDKAHERYMKAAAESGVAPLLPGTSGAAPRSSSRATVRSLLASTAMNSGVVPERSRALISAPLSRSRRTMSVCPARLA